MSVWAHVGAAELFRVCVHWLWFKKTNRMKGAVGGRRAVPLSCRVTLSPLLAAAATGPGTRGGSGQTATATPAPQKATSE